MTLYPDSFALVEIHIDDSYETSWCVSRASWYGVYYSGGTGLPTSWFDGWIQRVGAAVGVSYTSEYASAAAVSTDVTIDIGAVPDTGQTYDVTVKVCLEAGGVGKSMRIQIVQVLDDYPAGDYHNCLMQGLASEDITLAPGECEYINRTITFDAASWANQNNIKLIAWAHKISGGRNVYQAAQSAFPFEVVQPSKGDMNGDGTINSDDVPYFVMALVDRAAYDTEFAEEEYDADYIGDFTGDELLKGDDAQGFVELLLFDDEPPANLAWGEEPHPISSTEIRMAGYAEDRTPPIEFAYDGLVGGHDRAWDADPVYIDSGLAKNMYFQYTLAARDSSPLQNATGQDLLRTIGTAIETPSELTFGTIAPTSIEVFTAHDEDVGGVFTNLTFYDSGLFFEVTTLGGAPVGGGDANTWVQDVSQGITATGLTSGTTYRFRVKARNLFATETDWYPLDDPTPAYVEQATP